MPSRLRAKMRAGETVIGGGSGWWQPDVAQALNGIGLDFVVFDMQHGSASYDTISRFIQEVDQSGTAVLGRAASSATADVSKVLDVGALGVIVPDVETREETLHILGAARYPPVGRRSVDRMMTPAERDEYNESIVVIPMIETPAGVEDVEEIVSVGVDGVYIGPNDLSATLGVYTQWTHPVFLEAIEKVARACNGRSIPFGIMAPIDPPEKPIELGCRIFQVGDAVSFLRLGGMEQLQQARKTLEKGGIARGGRLY